MKIDFERLLPNRPEDADFQPIELGQPRYPGLLVDGFFREPDHVREFALSLRYAMPAAGYPGYFAEMSLPMAPVVSLLHERFAHWYFPSADEMAQRAQPAIFSRNERQRPGHPPRPAAKIPHIDPQLLAGVVYLNKPEHCRGGTAFFRHRATGAEALLPAPVIDPDQRGDVDPSVVDRMWRHGAQAPYDKAREAGLAADYPAYWQLLTHRTPGDAHDHIIDSCDGWELTRVIEMKYNRLVLYPSFLLHSGHFRDEWFGQTPDTCRLTCNLFFDWVRQTDPQ